MGLLDGTVAIVTGAGHGIGRAEAVTLAAHGAAVLNREAAARYLGISTATLERLTSAGKLRSIRVSEGRVGWTRKALDAYLAAQEQE